LSQAAKPTPSSKAQATPMPMAHHRLATSAPTSGVKYRPSAAPMVHWPRLRSGVQLSVAAPSTDARAVDSSGPIIQGMGVPSQAHRRAAAQASSRVRAVRVQDAGPQRDNKGGTG